jgi:hypothetical protein
MTTDYDSVDYFTDPSLVPDPHPYFDHLRAKNPVSCPINNGVLAVTGWEAANAVYKNSENYSSCVAHPRPAGRHQDQRGKARADRRAPLHPTSRPSSCAGSPS